MWDKKQIAPSRKQNQWQLIKVERFFFSGNNYDEVYNFFFYR